MQLFPHPIQQMTLTIEPPLPGRFQIDNALTAATAARLLAERGFEISSDAITQGIAAARWPGRLERLGERPAVYLDGTHNPAGARQLLHFWQENFAGRRIFLVYGAMRDKAVDEIAGTLFPQADTVILTQPRQPRAISAVSLQEMTGHLAKSTMVVPDACSARTCLGNGRSGGCRVRHRFAVSRRGLARLLGHAKDDAKRHRNCSSAPWLREFTRIQNCPTVIRSNFMELAEKAKPRMGIPYRTRKEELTGDFSHIEKYVRAINRAGGEPVVLSLGRSSVEVEEVARTLDAVLLSGSPADIDPSLFHAKRHSQTATPDSDRERTDFTLLDHAFADNKPVLAICYGIQSLNVFLGGTLVQDIPSEVGTAVEHEWEDEQGAPETFHPVSIEQGSQLAQIADAAEARVNSSHHQSILDPGRRSPRCRARRGSSR